MHFSRYHRWALIGLLLLSPLSIAAQTGDPFRSAAPSTPGSQPAAPAPTPAPTPPGVSTLPPAPQIWANVRQVAQAGGIIVPLSGAPAFDESGSPPQYRKLLGPWGPGTWQGNPGGEKIILVIQSVDNAGNVRGVVGRNTNDGWFSYAAQIANNRFALEVPITFHNNVYGARVEKDTWIFEVRADGTLVGSRNGSASSIVLTRLQ